MKNIKKSISLQDLDIMKIINVSRFNHKIRCNPSTAQINKIEQSFCKIKKIIEKQEIVYGVNTNFGGHAIKILEDPAEITLLQSNLLHALKCGAGKLLPNSHVRAAMLIRARSLIEGASGVRFKIIKRLIYFLNNNITPNVYELGSIGASGDLIPLSYIAGAITGLNDSYIVKYQNSEIGAVSLLKKLKLQKINLELKEGLALINGSSMMTAVASECIFDFKRLFQLNLNIHGFYAQAIGISDGQYDKFINQCKPHHGQIKVAEIFKKILGHSNFIKRKIANNDSKSTLLQDRYSFRCLPQYLGPIYDAIIQTNKHIEIEANSVTDNPIIDVQNNKVLHNGNFLGEYIGIDMDHLRHYIALIAKHLDAQIALLVEPAFSNGLTPSLANPANKDVCLGLKGLQICANSILPSLLLNQSNLTTRFQSHFEQFNQNISSIGYSSAILTWHTLDLLKYYLSINLLFCVQSIGIRSNILFASFDPRKNISPALVPVYESICKLINCKPSTKSPIFSSDSSQAFDEYIKIIKKDLDDNHSKILSFCDENINPN